MRTYFLAEIIRIVSARDAAITFVFMLVLLCYLMSVVISLILPSIISNQRAVKIILFIMSIIGGITLIIKHVTEFSEFIILGFLIVYVLAYLAGLALLLYKKRETERIAQKIIDAKKEYEKNKFR